MVEKAATLCTTENRLHRPFFLVEAIEPHVNAPYQAEVAWTHSIEIS